METTQSYFRHGRVQVGETWNFREDSNVFFVKITDRSIRKERDGRNWLSITFRILHVFSGDERWNGRTLTVQEVENSGHGLGMWSLRMLTTPFVSPDAPTA